MLEAAEWYIHAGVVVVVGLAFLSEAGDIVAAWRQEVLREEFDRRQAERCRACDAHDTIEDMARRLAAGQTLDASATVDADGHAELTLLWTTEDGEPIAPLDPDEAVEAAERLLRREGTG